MWGKWNLFRVSFAILLCLSWNSTLHAAAPAAATEFIYETATGRRLTLEEFASSLKSRDILVFGETHATAGNDSWKVHQGHQLELLKSLTQNSQASKFQLHLGMEFLEYPFQKYVNWYLRGAMADDEFVQEVKWGGNPFEAYKPQILEPAASGGKTWALNIPREITRQVSRYGLASLSPDQTQMLPPHLTRGNALYFERFQEALVGHAPNSVIENFFWSQSIWDETMAWKALQSFPAKSGTVGQILVIIVGQFHVEYGGGLPDRLKSRAQEAVSQGQDPFAIKTLVQKPLPTVDDASVSEAVAPNARYGELADYIWIFEDKTSAP